MRYILNEILSKHFILFIKTYAQKNSWKGIKRNLEDKKQLHTYDCIDFSVLFFFFKSKTSFPLFSVLTLLKCTNY